MRRLARVRARQLVVLCGNVVGNFFDVGIAPFEADVLLPSPDLRVDLPVVAGDAVFAGVDASVVAKYAIGIVKDLAPWRFLRPGIKCGRDQHCKRKSAQPHMALLYQESGSKLTAGADKRLMSIKGIEPCAT